MFKEWAKTVADDGQSLNTAFRLALIDMGGTAFSINTLIGDVMASEPPSPGLVWNTWGVKYDEESRHWDVIG